jgi:hypothetical protein
MKIIIFFLLLVGCKSRLFSQNSKQFSQTRDTSALVNESTNLADILQTAQGKKSCEKYQSIAKSLGDKATREQILAAVPYSDVILCGKHMFIYDDKASRAFPESVISGAVEAWPDWTGKSLTKFGAFENPDDPKFPLGMPRTDSVSPFVTAAMNNGTRTVSCALCHVGKLPDGRYSMGMTNENLRYGRLALLMSFPSWSLDQSRNDEKRWAPEIITMFNKMYKEAKRVKASAIMFLDFTFVPKAFPLTHFIFSMAEIPEISIPEQKQYLTDEPGLGPTFFIGLGSEQRLFLNPPSLWGIDSRRNNKDPRNDRLGTFLLSEDLESHIKESIIISTTSNKFISDRWVVPISEFLRSLKAPVPKSSPNTELFAKGETIYQKSCVSCHSNSAGGSGILVPSKRMALDSRYEAPLIKNFKPSNTLSVHVTNLLKQEIDTTTETANAERKTGIRPRRLKGVWARTRLMANGSVRGLEHAFCLNGKVRQEKVPTSDLSDAVHGDLCEIQQDDRVALKEYLEHWH